jgi:F0F1-type ATP synthase epsilon subunit
MSPAVAFTYQIMTPEGPWKSGVCRMLHLPTSRGQIGVLANHQALLCDVVPGEVSIEQEGGLEKVRVGSGIFEVAGNAATFLVDRAGEGRPD